MFKYNRNGNYSTKSLTSAYAGNNFLLPNVNLNEIGLYAKIQLLHISKHRHIAAKASVTTASYDE